MILDLKARRVTPEHKVYKGLRVSRGLRVSQVTQDHKVQKGTQAQLVRKDPKAIREQHLLTKCSHRSNLLRSLARKDRRVTQAQQDHKGRKVPKGRQDRWVRKGRRAKKAILVQQDLKVQRVLLAQHLRMTCLLRNS